MGHLRHMPVCFRGRKLDHSNFYKRSHELGQSHLFLPFLHKLAEDDINLEIDRKRMISFDDAVAKQKTREHSITRLKLDVVKSVREHDGYSCYTPQMDEV